MRRLEDIQMVAVVQVRAGDLEPDDVVQWTNVYGKPLGWRTVETVTPITSEHNDAPRVSLTFIGTNGALTRKTVDLMDMQVLG